MLKRFFISMLGTVAGIFISGILAFFVIFGLVGALVGKTLGSKTGTVEKHSILHLKLDGVLAERLQTPSFMDLVQGNTVSALALDEIRTALTRAADDPKIDGVFIDCGNFASGVASCEELVNSINGFKERSHKWVYAYADNYNQGAYLVASAADSIFVNPIGGVDVHGAAMINLFFKDLLDKVGVKMQIIKVGTYKSAVEPFILNEMSAPARLQQQEYVDSIWEYMVESIARGRSIERHNVVAWADSVCAVWPTERTVSSGLADAAVYRRVMEKRLRSLTDCDDDTELRLVTPSAYVAAGNNSLVAIDNNKNHIAVLYACGDIVDKGTGGIVGEKMVPEIVSLADDDKVKGLVLRVNSGGGSAFASEQIWEALEYFKSKGKPFYVSMGDYAASGGYYISCGANRIFADATTLTGSIGVFGMIPEASSLLDDKLGVHFSTVESNANAAFPVVFRPLTPDQYAALQSGVDNTYSLFTQRVADGRDMPVDSVRAIAEGRVWVGSSAVRLGLVDEIGDLYDAVYAMASEIGLSADDVIAYPQDGESMWATLLRESNTLEAARAAAGYSPVERRAIEIARRLSEQNHIQARMPFFIVR